MSVLMLSVYSCKEDVVGQYPVEFVAPDSVSKVTYESLPGAVKLTYKLPSDGDLLYVKAVYYLDNGNKMEAAASAFTNTLTIDGYGNGDSLRTVSLVAVDINQNVSLPIVVKVKPLESPIYEVMNSLKADKDFGGIYLKWLNPLKANVIVVVTTDDKAGKPVVALGGKFYSSADTAVVNVRGYDTIPRNFYIQVMDRWGNKTKIDTLKNITPIFEQLIPKGFHAKWNGDALIPYQEYNGSFGIDKVWNNKWGSTSGGDCFSTRAGGGVSNSITYDLNSQANNTTGQGWVIPSRLKLYARYNYGYTATPEYLRVWGSTSPNVSMANTEGPDAWVLLSPPGGFHITPPSGAAGRDATTADKTFIMETGYDLVFGPGVAPIRYVRLEAVSMWGGANNTSFTYGELEWYGMVTK